MLGLRLGLLGPVLASGQANFTEIRRAQDVRELNAAQAAEQRPVLLQAHVVYVDAPGTVFVQDDSGATFLRSKSPLPLLRVGDLVRVVGTTVPGLYLPGVDTLELTILGRGELRPAPLVTYDDLMSGRFHYSDVQITGVGRLLELDGETKSVLRLATGRHVLEVRVDAPLAEAPASLVDAEISVRGLAAGGINDRRQLLHPYLKVRAWDQIQVLSPAPDVAMLPLTRADQLMAFGSDATSARRVRLEGTVLAVFESRRLFVRSSVPARDDPNSTASLAFAVYCTHMLKGIAPGQAIRVVGFPIMDGYSAAVADATVTVLEADDPVRPTEALAVSLAALRSGVHDADLVVVNGTVQAAFPTTEHTELVLRAEGGEFRAMMPAAVTTPEIGAMVRVTGICEVEGTLADRGFRSFPSAARVLLRSSADLVLLDPAPWWTARRLVIALGWTAGLLLLAAAWIALLQRQVKRQTATIRHQIANEAVMDERHRIAREFHDTLEQELAGLSLRLDAATTRPLDSKAASLLTTSRHLVSRIQTEARNLVADLRSDVASASDLRLALDELAQRATVQDGPQVVTRLPSSLPDLPAHLVHHLRMIAQEAVTNALKHAQAKRIEIALHADPERLLLTVADDGCGLLSSDETLGKAGHFGCMGIRERSRSMGAEVAWSSQVDQGTTLSLSLPLVR
jgi:signal transduction histidine kinase